MSNDFHIKEHCSRTKTKNSTVSDNQISQLVLEMVEITTKRLSKGPSENKNLVAQKSDTVVKSASEKEQPVRRSNRIRRTVVKKDEILTLRPNKKTNNKSQKSTESPVLKTSEKELINISDHKKMNENFNKEISKNKSSSKASKSDKITKNSNQLLQSEKKKTSRKGKTQKNIENLNTEDRTNSSFDSDCKINQNLQTQPLSLASSCFNALNNVSKTEMMSSENQSNTQKLSDDQNSETSEKSVESCNKPVKVKSRWWRSSELEAVMNSELVNPENSVTKLVIKSEDAALTIDDVKTPDQASNAENGKKISDDDSPNYEHIKENIYRFNRKKCKSKKQVRRMVCDCTLTKEELEHGMLGCKEECLNRLLMIECGSRCPIGEACSNKKFQKKQYARAELIKTEKKGWGLRSLEDISVGDFVLEFVGEVLNHKEYRQRVKQYAKEKNVHSYFMALKTDEILDATSKGNFSRFINHSCSPNCETQKWTVNGELRIGVFAKWMIYSGEELTLDYQFQRYGREAQKCFCGADICSGFIGSAKQISIDAYSSNKQQGSSRKRKGSEDKKREIEDMIFEEELEKLSGSRGLRNRDDTLKLARLMVRADDPNTRHKLLDITLKTDQPACLRLFLDYHGLPLLWSWMTDVMELGLKAKILQVLSLLPITNKTMLLDSKVMSIVEKWQSECSAESKDPKSLGSTEYAIDAAKKLKMTELSDSETDSTSSHTIADTFGDAKMSADEGSLLEAPKEESPGPGSDIKKNITSVATGLLKNWNRLKEVFRIPRLEQQKRKEDELEVDNRAKEQDNVRQQPTFSAYNEVGLKCGDQIQVVISGKNRDRSYDYEPPETELDSGPRRFSQSRTLPVVSTIPRHPVVKSIRTPNLAYPPLADSDGSKHNRKEKEALPPNVCIPDMSPRQMPPDTFPPPMYSELSFAPPAVDSAPPPVIYPPQMMFPPSPMPFMGSAPSMLPHNPAVMPPPTSMASQQPPPHMQQPPLTSMASQQPPPHMQQPPPTSMASQPPPSHMQQPPPTCMASQQPPPHIQQPPLQAGQMPICHPSSVGAPPCPSNFLLPQNVPPSSVVPPSQVQQQPHPMHGYTPGVYSNPGQQQQPLYFVPQQQINNPPPAFPESIPIQQSSSTFPIQTLIPVMKEEPVPKPVRLPKNWRTATDSEGNVYYYHSITRQTQWDPPSENENESDDEEEDSSSEESESSDTPTYDEPKVITKHSRKKSKKRKPTKAAADTSVVPVRPEIAKKIKELFRTKISSFIVHCLNVYRKPSCNIGRITSNEDFKYLARKLTHYTMTKELKQCKNVEDLDCNETVMHKAKDFIKKYMAKYGSQYSRKDKSSPQ